MCASSCEVSIICRFSSRPYFQVRGANLIFLFRNMSRFPACVSDSLFPTFIVLRPTIRSIIFSESRFSGRPKPHLYEVEEINVTKIRLVLMRGKLRAFSATALQVGVEVEVGVEVGV